MSHNVNSPSSIIESLLKVLTTTNALLPAAVPGIAAIKAFSRPALKPERPSKKLKLRRRIQWPPRSAPKQRARRS